MVRFSILPLVAFGIRVGAARGVIFTLLTDEFDDWKTVQAAQDDKEVEALRKEMEVLKGQIRRLKERDIEALFGAPVPMRTKTFALPVAESRGLALSGLRYKDAEKNKDHTEFYTVGESAGMEVYYSLDGVSPMAIIFYLRVNDDFPVLTKDNLAKRLAWEQRRLRKLPRIFESRRAAVFVWEVDPEAEKKYFQDDYSSEAAAKLRFWLASCDKLGYRADIGPRSAKEGADCTWYRTDGTAARHVYSYPGSQLPNEFIWYHADGHTEYRREYCQRDDVAWWRWCRPGTTDNIRFESAAGGGRPSSWTWYDEKGKCVRREWDDNGDGIPDWFANKDTDMGQRLDLDKSWAVHPELIPEESRIPDQPNRHVPLRRIVLSKEGD